MTLVFCCMAMCKKRAVVLLEATDGVLPFCAKHATEYEQLGYRRRRAA